MSEDTGAVTIRTTPERARLMRAALRGNRPTIVSQAKLPPEHAGSAPRMLAILDDTLADLDAALLPVVQGDSAVAAD